MTNKLIYLDHAAAAPLHPAVLQAMLPYLEEPFGNPSSVHSFGRSAKNALNDARDQISSQLNCDPGELVFTSGGTESNNLAIYGAALAQQGIKKHIITSQTEHQAVLFACNHLETLGFDVTYLPVDRFGQIQISELEAAIRPDTILVSLMYGNNEVGTLQPIYQIGQLAQEKSLLFHVDAVQALGLIDLDLKSLPVHLMSFSAHKINGPKGIGALYVARKTLFAPHIRGGSQERGRRAGTENLAGIAGFAEAVKIAVNQSANKQHNTRIWRQMMIDIWKQELGENGFFINGHISDILPHILNVSFPGVESETLLMNLDLEGIAAASGSACTSGSSKMSHVLLAMRLPIDQVSSAVRFSFGLGNTTEEVQAAA
ncbi:MAG TPA: cysteine desulfurase family protein, partial [Bacilli bacterium]